MTLRVRPGGELAALRPALRRRSGRATGGGGAGEGAEDGVREPAVAGEGQGVRGALGAERADPGIPAAADGRAGALALARLADLDAAARRGEAVAAIGHVALALDDQVDAPLHAGWRLDHAGREAEHGADIDVLARARRAPGPVVAPAGELADHRHQLARALGQLIVHPRRHLAVPLTGEQPVGDHPVQPRPQLLGGDAWEHPLELDEAAGPGRKV